MKVIDTRIPDVKILEPKVFKDDRGFFLETWNKRQHDPVTGKVEFVQDNFSRSKRGTVRGLHYQIEQTQDKLIRVSQGEVFDVAVDLRRSSPTFGQWAGAILSGNNCRQLWIPKGFAHGFMVLSESADLVYKCTDFYLPEAERTILWNDNKIGIEWPTPADSPTILSAKDQQGCSFLDAEYFA